MKRTLFFHLIFSILFGGASALAQVSAEASTSSPVVRRNSPFAPNPKKKNEPKPMTHSEDTAKMVPMPAGRIVKVENVSFSSGATPNNAQPVPSAPGKESAAKSASAAPIATEIYRVGRGDILFITLINAPGKESTYFTVLSDGSIDYPLAGEIVQVAGLTTEQIEKLLREKIKLYENPQVSVRIREYNSHNFTVLGLVENPGERQMHRDAIPLYVVKAEAMVQAKANQVIIQRNGVNPQTLDLRDPKTSDFLIFPGDTVEFRSEQPFAGSASNYYFIGGEIISAGRRPIIDGLTLTQAILESGGLKKSKIKKIVIRRRNAEGLLVPTQYDLKAIKDGKVADPVLVAGDTIEVGN
jgi:protein involved in polysaccharide export with SLBB domain